jgi:hypothetical protein
MSTTPEPLDTDAVDLLLSAELDGDLDGAARDLGIDPADARARLAATPGTDARRDALVAAQAASRALPALVPASRAALLASVHEERAPGTDDLAPRRAARATPPWTRRFALAGAAAAAVLLVVAVVAIAGSGDDADDAGTAASEDREQGFQAYGDVSEELTLRALIDPDAAEGRDAPEAAGSDDDSGDESDATAPLAPADELRVRSCSDELAAELADGQPPIEIGGATYEGAPAGLAVFDLDGRRFAVVFDPATCVPLKTLLGPS